MNGGTCVGSGDSFSCICREGWEGRTCTHSEFEVGAGCCGVGAPQARPSCPCPWMCPLHLPTKAVTPETCCAAAAPPGSAAHPSLHTPGLIHLPPTAHPTARPCSPAVRLQDSTFRDAQGHLLVKPHCPSPQPPSTATWVACLGTHTEHAVGGLGGRGRADQPFSFLRHRHQRLQPSALVSGSWGAGHRGELVLPWGSP